MGFAWSLITVEGAAAQVAAAAATSYMLAEKSILSECSCLLQQV